MKIFGRSDKKKEKAPSDLALDIQSKIIGELVSCGDKAKAIKTVTEIFYVSCGCFMAYLEREHDLGRSEAAKITSMLMEKLTNDVRGIAFLLERQEDDED